MTELPIDPPDTELAGQARQLLHTSCEAHVVAHCERSFQFAALLALAEGTRIDTEVLYIGTVLHDVGLAARFEGEDRFEMRGANAVRTMLRQAGMQTARAESVWDVIALHGAVRQSPTQERRDANRQPGHQHRRARRRCRRAPRGCSTQCWTRVSTRLCFGVRLTIVAEVCAHPSATRSSWLKARRRPCARVPARRLPRHAALVRALRLDRDGGLVLNAAVGGSVAATALRTDRAGTRGVPGILRSSGRRMTSALLVAARLAADRRVTTSTSGVKRSGSSSLSSFRARTSLSVPVSASASAR